MSPTTDVNAAPPKPKTPAKVVYIAIKSIGTVAMTITVEPRHSMSTEAKTYKVTPETAVKVNGNPATLADLKPDMAVHFTLAADNVTATKFLSDNADSLSRGADGQLHHGRLSGAACS